MENDYKFLLLIKDIYSDASSSLSKLKKFIDYIERYKELIHTDSDDHSMIEKELPIIRELIKKKFNFDIKIEQLNADHTNDVVKLLKKYKPDIVLNLALPYQDLTIMEACLREKVHYLDTANYEPKNEAKFEYKWQWDLHNNFSKK